MKTRRRTWICSLLATGLLVGVLLVDGPGGEARSDLPVSPATGDVAKPSDGVKASPMKASPMKATPAMHVATDDAATDVQNRATGKGATQPGPGAKPDEKPAEDRPALEAQPTSAETGK